MEPLGLVEIETARIARFEAERIDDEQARAQAVLDAVPTDEELAARDLQQRRDDAYDEAVKASIEASRIKCGESYENADLAFKASAADSDAGIEELFVKFSTLKTLHASFVAATVQLNNVNQSRVVVTGGLVDLTFAEVCERILAGRASIAHRIAATEVAERGQNAGGVAAAKVK
jgi:hypothetical protein